MLKTCPNPQRGPAHKHSLAAESWPLGPSIISNVMPFLYVGGQDGERYLNKRDPFTNSSQGLYDKTAKIAVAVCSRDEHRC